MRVQPMWQSRESGFDPAFSHESQLMSLARSLHWAVPFRGVGKCMHFCGGGRGGGGPGPATDSPSSSPRPIATTIKATAAAVRLVAEP